MSGARICDKPDWESMMSDLNVKLVRSIYDAFKRGDVETIVNAASPNIHWEITGRKKDFPLLGVRKGQQGVQDFFNTLAETQDVSEFSPREFYAACYKVFVTGHYGWKIRKTGRS